MLVKLQGVLVYQNEIGRKEHRPSSYGAAELLVGGQFFTINMNCTKLLMDGLLWFFFLFFFPLSQHSVRDWEIEIRKADTCSGGGLRGKE